MPATENRCWWCLSAPDYVAYHDDEWGRPVDDDVRLYEKLTLEGFQSGLSWLTILRKRDNFRAAFRDFDPEVVAAFGARDVTRLLADAGIVRHRKKIESAINNARRVIEIGERYGSLSAFIWAHEPDAPAPTDEASVRSRAVTPESRALAKALKQHGFSFVGPTTAYAFMQSMGLVNDHVEGCASREKVAVARRRFRRPTSPFVKD